MQDSRHYLADLARRNAGTVPPPSPISQTRGWKRNGAADDPCSLSREETPSRTIKQPGRPLDIRQAPNIINVTMSMVPSAAPPPTISLDSQAATRKAWDAIAHDWELNQSPEVNGQAEDGNDMFTQCLLPVLDELAHCTAGEAVLGLGAGSGIIARRFARKGANVLVSTSRKG